MSSSSSSVDINKDNMNNNSTLPIRIGQAGNIVLLVGTFVITTCFLFRLPSISIYDESWLKLGFCVKNPSDPYLNSHSLSFYVDALSALCLFILYYVGIKKDTTNADELLRALMRGAIGGVLLHGLGHLQYGQDPDGMNMKFDINDIPKSMINLFVNCISYGGIFYSVLPLASSRKIMMTTIITILIYQFLDLPKKLTFTYAQAAILLAQSMHGLSLAPCHITKESHMTYAIYPYVSIPILFFGIIESTNCLNFLQQFGGHAIYDAYIALSYFLLYYLVKYFNTEQKEKTI